MTSMLMVCDHLDLSILLAELKAFALLLSGIPSSSLLLKLKLSHVIL